jgi:hypothetical protein
MLAGSVSAAKNLAGAKLHCNRSVVVIPRVRVCRVSTGKGFPCAIALLYTCGVRTIVLDPISQGTN